MGSFLALRLSGSAAGSFTCWAVALTWNKGPFVARKTGNRHARLLAYISVQEAAKWIGSEDHTTNLKAPTSRGVLML